MKYNIQFDFAMDYNIILSTIEYFPNLKILNFDRAYTKKTIGKFSLFQIDFFIKYMNLNYRSFFIKKIIIIEDE